MANSVTEKTTLTFPKGLYKWGYELIPIVVYVDTGSVDITVKAGVTGKKLGLIGGIVVMGVNQSISIKTGTSEEAYVPLSAQSGFWEGISDSIFYITQPGETLKIQLTVESGSPNGKFLFWVAVID